LLPRMSGYPPWNTRRHAGLSPLIFDLRHCSIA
jgi:hypothetical protein